MSDQPLIAEDRLRQFRDDDTVCASPFERAMAAELLENRAALAAASAAILFASEQVAQANVGHASIRARIAELETEADRLRERRRTWLLRYRTARDRITELEAERDNALQTTRDSQRVSSEDHMQLSWERDLAREERDVAQARITELQGERVADEFGIQSLTTVNGVATLATVPTTEQARELVLTMSLACGQMLDADQAQNYIEFEASPANRPGYIVHVRRAGGPSPHTLRREAEVRAEQAEARVAELEQQAGRRRIEITEELEALGFPCVIREIPNDPFELYPPIWEMGYQTAWCRAGVEYRTYDSSPRLPVEVLVEPPEVSDHG